MQSEDERFMLHIENLGTKLHTPTYEAILFPDGRLLLKRGEKLFGMEQEEMIALVKFLSKEIHQ